MEYWDYPNPFIEPVTVLVEQIDGLQHTNNAVYVRWCEQAAWAHSVSLGLGLEQYHELNRAMVVTHSQYEYLAASHAGDQLNVGTWIVEWDAKLTMLRKFQIVRVADSKVVLRGSMRFACVELKSGKPRRLPKEFIAGYGPAVLPLEH